MKEEHSRTAALLGEENLDKLLRARVIVFGLGGVGSYVVEALARAGVGTLTLVDGDTVSLSNINRQLYALHSTVGQNKTDVAAARVLDITPDCSVRTIAAFVTPENVDGFFEGSYDFCVDAIDDTRAKTAIAVKCAAERIPLIAAMGTGRKLRSDGFRIADINQTEYCPLCRVMRRKYKEAGLKKVTVLYSPDPPAPPRCDVKEDGGRTPPSSISFIPSAAGLRIAEYVVNALIGD